MLRVVTIGTVVLCYDIQRWRMLRKRSTRVLLRLRRCINTEHTDADGWCALPERCAVATLTVDFAENGSVIVNLTEEEKGRTR